MSGAFYDAEVTVTTKKKFRIWARDGAEAEFTAKIRARDFTGTVVKAEVEVARVRVQVDA